MLPLRPGYVQHIDVDDLAACVGAHASRLAILVCPGDFVSAEAPIAQLWPADAADAIGDAVAGAIAITSERDLHQDVDFGVRQLADTALRAMSPGINDPMTAVTCVGYLRSILARLASRADPPRVRRYPEHDLVACVRVRAFGEYLDALEQLNRYVEGDAWVAGEMIGALGACAAAAGECGAADRVRLARELAATIAAQAVDEAGNERDRRRLAELAADVATW